MSKIVQAVNAMISNPNLISRVVRSEAELFFIYKNKYTWSMSKNHEGSYFLFFYPEKYTIDQLASLRPDEWEEHIELVKYSAAEIGTREAKASFAELYTILGEQIYGLHSILDDIISDESPF